LRGRRPSGVDKFSARDFIALQRTRENRPFLRSDDFKSRARARSASQTNAPHRRKPPPCAREIARMPATALPCDGFQRLGRFLPFASLQCLVIAITMLSLQLPITTDATPSPTPDPTTSAPVCSYYSCAELESMGTFVDTGYGSKWICGDSNLAKGACPGAVSAIKHASLVCGSSDLPCREAIKMHEPTAKATAPDYARPRSC
jgi:hypothetical protein